MTKIINNQCDKNGNPYITHLDFLRTIANYDENGKFQYLQSTDGTQYNLKQLSNMKMNFDLKLLDPAYQWNNGSILAKDQNTPKHAEVEISPKSQIKSCINTNKLDNGLISIDTTRHGCDVGKLFNAKNDAFKINLTEGVKANDEFAMLGGTVNLTNKGNWIDLGLNEWELSNIRVKITKDCFKEEKPTEEIEEKGTCKPDSEAFMDHKNDIVVKSIKSGEKVGSVNSSSWSFEKGELYYCPTSDICKTVGKGNVYLKVLPCDEQKPYYKLALCDKNGNLVTETQKKDVIDISKCNLVGGQKIELEDYFRDDGLPSFVIKGGGFLNNMYRAEVFKYDPTSRNIGDKVGHLNDTRIVASREEFGIEETGGNTFTGYCIDGKNVTIKGSYMDKACFTGQCPEFDGFHYPLTPPGKVKLLLEEVLCLCDQDVLQDGIQIIG